MSTTGKAVNRVTFPLSNPPQLRTTDEACRVLASTLHERSPATSIARTVASQGVGLPSSSHVHGFTEVTLYVPVPFREPNHRVLTCISLGAASFTLTPPLARTSVGSTTKRVTSCIERIVPDLPADVSTRSICARTVADRDLELSHT